MRYLLVMAMIILTPPKGSGGGDPGDSPGDAGRERAPCRRVYVYGQDGEHDGYRYLYIKGRG